MYELIGFYDEYWQSLSLFACPESLLMATRIVEFYEPYFEDMSIDPALLEPSRWRDDFIPF